MKNRRRSYPHAALDAETLARITPFGVVKTFEADVIIHNRGDATNHLGVVLQGGVALFTLGKTGRRMTTAILARGEIYGAYTLQAARPRTMDAQAVGKTRVLTFTRPAFRNLLDVDAAFRDAFILHLSDAIERLVQSLDDHRRLPVQVRLAKLLLRYSRNEEQLVLLTQTDLAQLLAVSRYALGANLAKLASQGLVSPSYGRIHVPSRDRLRDWVDSRSELAEA